MKIPSRTTPAFWQLYHELAPEVKAVARKNFLLWSEHAFHPSLHFKPLGGENWSVRVGARHRAVGRFAANGFLWEWIGQHDEYDKRF